MGEGAKIWVHCRQNEGGMRRAIGGEQARYLSKDQAVLGMG